MKENTKTGRKRRRKRARESAANLIHRKKSKRNLLKTRAPLLQRSFSSLNGCRISPISLSSSRKPGHPYFASKYNKLWTAMNSWA
jgi:hypothetical protein